MDDTQGLSSPEAQPEATPLAGSPEGAPAGSEVQGQGEGSSQPQGTPAPSESERINALMSKWQSTEARAVKAERELQEFKLRQPEALKETLPPYYDPNWAPSTFDELASAMKIAEERGEQRALSRLQTQETERLQAKQQLDGFIEEAKLKDPTFDDQAFYTYANKHSFPVNTLSDLKAVLSSYQERKAVEAETEQRVRKNLQGRKEEPVSKSGGAAQGSSTTWTDIRKAGSIYEAAMQAFRRK